MPVFYRLRLRYRQLYLGKRCLFDKGNYSSTWRWLENEKRIAVKEIFEQYGIEETEAFGHYVKNIQDVATKLGCSLTSAQMSNVITACYLGLLTKDFTVLCVESYINKYGADKLLETSLCKMEENFILEILSSIPFSLELLQLVKHVLSDDVKYWEKASMPYCCGGDDIEELCTIIENLISCKRYVTAINIVGRSVFEAKLDPNSIQNLLRLAGTEESVNNETIDNYAVQKIIRWLQKQECISLEQLSDIEFIYLPVFETDSEVKPHALNTRLSLDPDYFCSMMELFYKKHSDQKHEIELNNGIKDRLIKILFQFKVTPGYGWKGTFDEKRFRFWMDSVKNWSEENDRYVITMQTVGSGLSYAPLDVEKLPLRPIIEELNKPENHEMRRGYYLGILNQRGVYFVDPEGKPEKELAKDYNDRANAVESKGYSRYANVLRQISFYYNKEAMQNISGALNTTEA